MTPLGPLRPLRGSRSALRQPDDFVAGESRGSAYGLGGYAAFLTTEYTECTEVYRLLRWLLNHTQRYLLFARLLELCLSLGYTMN